MAAADPVALRYLSAADVEAAMPPVEERLRLAEQTLTALVDRAELPAKIGVHPRPPGAFAHAMPALLRGDAADGSDDRLGMKWVTGAPGNRASGLPSISATVLLSDAATGRPIAILDGGPITAQRTAAITGVAIARFGPRPVGGQGGAAGLTVALIGAGVQGWSHVPVIGAVLPGATVRIHDRHPERAATLADAAAATSGIAGVEVAGSPREAAAGADVVVTMASFTEPANRQALTGDWLAPGALVVAVDYATMVAASVARDAPRFLVDERGQFIANRDAGQFDGYPDPTATIGEAIVRGEDGPRPGRTLVTHLGVGLADVIFASAILERAEAAGIGTRLPR